ncbi:cytochrome c oxidase assembly protein [Porphyrobacter sp. TH134]|uniref:cytochrome c oxidase assembly protein n=1 Tax=Porphyrobacter sp. TH134 TaxID=2067450 RepID=UPI000C7A6782|nr:cytochrome c oxidase assembly protein [Porphyrobacter sp. TH134]PLK28106.1 cytochrome c oxidase assembly protein [Porphyrobacter sp. TH134]
MATLPPVSDDAARRNLRTGALAFTGALAMLGLGYASVPLYRLFCQVTGFGGTTMQATESDAARAATLATGRQISIRFDGTSAMGMPWTFRPVQATDTVTIGERDIATYTARNDSDQPITGMATFNVTPEQAGKYFNKIQCFCFTEQTLQPGQEVTMPVLYFVDPAMLDDPNMAGVEQITLSYTFHRAKDPVNPAASGIN